MSAKKKPQQQYAEALVLLKKAVEEVTEALSDTEDLLGGLEQATANAVTVESNKLSVREVEDPHLGLRTIVEAPPTQYFSANDYRITVHGAEELLDQGTTYALSEVQAGETEKKLSSARKALTLAWELIEEFLDEARIEE